MDVSVVIPTHNRAPLIGRALASVQAQTLPAREIIVVDDGSEDDTASRVQAEFPRVRYLHEPNRGVSSARNLGIRNASGEWIALLDSDDEWLAGKLQAQCDALTREPEHRVCHTEEIWIRNGRRVNPMHKHAKAGGRIFRRCLPLCVISPSSALIHRSVFDEVGLFDESLPACEDYDLWLRICAHQPVLFVDTPLIVKHGGHDDQLSRRHWGMDRFRVQALRKIIDADLLAKDDRDAAIETLLTKSRILASGAEKRGNRQTYAEFRAIEQHYGALLDEDLSHVASA